MVSTDMVLETGFRNSLKDCLACKAEGPEGCVPLLLSLFSPLCKVAKPIRDDLLGNYDC